MPFPRSWCLWPLAGFLFFALIGWISDFTGVRSLFIKKIFIILPPVMYFLLYLLYYLIGSSIWPLVEDKLMFLLIPVFGFALFSSEFFRKNIRFLLSAFILGILVICIYQITRVSLESISFSEGSLKFNKFISPGISRFNWDQFSTFEHPTYLAIKVLWGISLLLFAKEALKLKIYFRISLVIFFTVILLFLSVKASILILIIFYILFIYRNFNKARILRIILVAVPVIVFVLLIYARNNVRMVRKFDELKTRVLVEKVHWKDVDPRTRSWYTSLILIKERPLSGVGLNIREVLSEKYLEQGFKTEADLRLNAHNQYLETQLAFGILGTLVLFWMLLAPLKGRKKFLEPGIVIPFLIIISVSMIFESILVRQWGIMFFVLFYCILTIPDKKSITTGEE